MKTLMEDLAIVREIVENIKQKATRQKGLRALDEIETRLSWMGIKKEQTKEKEFSLGQRAQ